MRGLLVQLEAASFRRLLLRYVAPNAPHARWLVGWIPNFRSAKHTGRRTGRRAVDQEKVSAAHVPGHGFTRKTHKDVESSTIKNWAKVLDPSAEEICRGKTSTWKDTHGVRGHTRKRRRAGRTPTGRTQPRVAAPSAGGTGTSRNVTRPGGNAKRCRRSGRQFGGFSQN